MFEIKVATGHDTDAKSKWDAARMIGVHRCARNALTVLARVVRGNHVLALVAFVILYFLDNLVEEIVKKFVGADEFIAITELVNECTESYDTLIRRILGNIHVEGAERRVLAAEKRVWKARVSRSFFQILNLA